MTGTCESSKWRVADQSNGILDLFIVSLQNGIDSVAREIKSNNIDNNGPHKTMKMMMVIK